MVPKRHWFEHEDRGEAEFTAVEHFEELEFEKPIYYVRPNGRGTSFFQIPQGISVIAERSTLLKQIAGRHIYTCS